MKNTIKILATVFVAAIALMSFNSCKFSISTANIAEVKLCSGMDNKKLQCPGDTKKFSKSTPQIFATCFLNNAPKTTKVTFSWYYTNGERVLIDEVSALAGDMGTGSHFNLYSNLNSPKRGWPAGDYEIVISLNSDNSEPVVRKFSIA